MFKPGPIGSATPVNMPAMPEGREPSGDEIREAARQFEAILVGELYKVMRRTVPDSGLVDGGFSQDVFSGMLDEELARQTASTGSLGLADTIAAQLAGRSRGPVQLPDAIAAKLTDDGWFQPVAEMPSRFGVGQRFGAERPGDRPEQCGGGHCGIDVGKPVGTPVVAARAGTIIGIGNNPDSAGGLSIAIRHGDGFVTRYLHLDRIGDGLRVGDFVKGGQTIADVGATGTSAHGSHLHFELEYRRPAGGVIKLDPQHYLPGFRPAPTETQDSPQGPGASVDARRGDLPDPVNSQTGLREAYRRADR